MWIQYKASRGTTHKGFVANYEGRKITFSYRNTYDGKLYCVCNYPDGCHFNITVSWCKREVSDGDKVLTFSHVSQSGFYWNNLRKLCSEYYILFVVVIGLWIGILNQWVLFLWQSFISGLGFFRNFCHTKREDNNFCFGKPFNNLSNNVLSWRLQIPLSRKGGNFFRIFTYYDKQFTTEKTSRTCEVTNIWLDHFAFSQWQITYVKIRCPWAPRTIKEIELFCSFVTVLNGNTNIVSCSNVILVLPLEGIPCTGFVQETTKKKLSWNMTCGNCGFCLFISFCGISMIH